MGKRISAAILAVLATSVIACGSSGAGSAGRVDAGNAGGDARLMADDTYGVNAAQVGDGAAGSISDTASGPQLQP